MEKQMNKIMLLLFEEVELLKTLKTILSNQKELIFSSNPGEFADSVMVEDDLLKRIKKIDLERLVIFNNMSTYFNLNKQLTLTNLIELVEEPYKTKLSGFKGLFTELVDDIRQMNMENRYLVKKSMVFVQKNLNMLKDFTKNNYIYSLSGNYGPVNTPVNRLLDTKL